MSDGMREMYGRIIDWDRFGGTGQIEADEKIDDMAQIYTVYGVDWRTEYNYGDRVYFQVEGGSVIYLHKAD